MKRSEIVLKIAESLVEPRFLDDPMKEADAILKRLEKAGMQPPEIDSGIYNRADCQNYWVNEWEPEDKGK